MPPLHRLCLAVVLAVSTSSLAHAQRESFDASVLRKAEVIITELEVRPSTVPVPRRGLTAEGAEATQLGSRESLTFANIYFKLDSTELRDAASVQQVAEIAMAMQSPRWRGLGFLIEGHTCELGSDEHNLRLSARRAEAIRQRLILAGVAAERLAALGFGERELVAAVTAEDKPAAAEAKRCQCRRVVLRQLIRPAQ